MRFVLDENLPPRLARALAFLDVDVVHVTAIMPAGTDDVTWLAGLADHGIAFVVTRDTKMRQRAAEFRAMQAAGLGVFFLCGGEMTGLELARTLLHHWPEMGRVADSQSRPFFYRMGRKGRPKRWRVPQ